MKTAQELLALWNPTDIKEHWDEFTTVQPFRHTITQDEKLVFVTKCEVCRTPVWLSFATAPRNIVEEHKLNETCACDEMEQEPEQCHHGLSAWLCEDPINHYPPDHINF